MAQDWLDDVYSSAHVVQSDMEQVEKNFACLKSMFSGSSAPANPVPFQLWANSSNSVVYYRGTGSSWEEFYDVANDRIAAGLVDGVSIKTSAILSSNFGATCVKTANLDVASITNDMLNEGAASINKLALYSSGASLMVWTGSSYTNSVGATANWYNYGYCVLGPSGVVWVELHCEVSGGSTADQGYWSVLLNGSTITGDYTIKAGSLGASATFSTYIETILPATGNNIINFRMRRARTSSIMQGKINIRAGAGPMITSVVSTTRTFTFTP